MSFGQGGPSWGPGGPGENRTPDWAALAEASAARGRRRKWLMIGGGALATAAVAAIVATAVITTGNHGGASASDGKTSQLPAPEDLPEQSTAPQPSFSSVAPPPPPDPKDYIADARKDKAPVTVDAFFPGKKLTMGDRVYAKGATHDTRSCAATTQGALGSILTANGCDQVVRATYSKDGVAVTVGLAVFATEAEAKKAAQEASGGLASLSGAGVPTFCRGGAVCRRTSNYYGRYAYFTVGGFTDGTSVTKADKDVFAAGNDVRDFTFRQIRHRGEVQASAAAEPPTT
ncbi:MULTISPECIES: hypothetical protein [unclassified Streptomyces]|uniref:hypothetical protein n=1 Tax=unclassified Streptomyces TaxID=2593676 RepID=UPI0001C1A1F9|nr:MULTISPECIES: hypothetical protein [unclassified Streptomyces]AEN11841.1 conserved hypothetical protein [Streptomyces sp. SirexAA-E]MYR69645.1 hypothetical protein [Streptomyces sp. SID4939]MYS03744.1 hypothetical protein [Streptomyces sp. SID4940]MYT65121.1 hypothetical protein [Streptomyces sp. SID8357]MYT85003.1 hypothetical protein [Streptomyces sp. SID8360]